MTRSGLDAVTRALSDAVGGARLLAGDAARDFTVAGVAPALVVSPGSLDEVSRVLSVASAHGLAVAPSGNGTRLGWGAPPARLDVVLSLRRLDRVLAYEPADLTLSIEAGVTVGAVNARLAPHGQFLPLDPAHAERSTVGGLIATGAAGPYRARYGTMRDVLLGVTLVRGDGTVVKGGGRVVKNVTGYDVPKLQVGALGTLAVVVEAHLRLHPRPLTESTWVFPFGSAEAALEAALAIQDSAVVLSRLELLERGAWAALGEANPPSAALAVTIGSVLEAVRAQGAQVAEVCRRLGAEPVPVPDAGRWWQDIAAVTWPREPDSTLALRIGTRPTDLVKALRAVEAAQGGRPGTASGHGLVAAAEVANGVLHATVTGEPSALPDVLRRARESLAPLDGTCVVEHAPTAIKATLDVWGDVGAALGPMRRLKAELDPGGVLNPGRFVGGL